MWGGCKRSGEGVGVDGREEEGCDEFAGTFTHSSTY